MNFWETAETLDTLWTVGQLAVCIGCPVAGVTAVAAKILIKQGAKLAIKKCITTGVVSGATATACAFFTMGTGEGEGNVRSLAISPPGIPQEFLEAESMRLVVQESDSGETEVLLCDRVIEKDEVVKELLPALSFGKLSKVEYSIELPEGEGGEWFLYMQEVQSTLENVRPDFEFVESVAGNKAE